MQKYRYGRVNAALVIAGLAMSLSAVRVFAQPTEKPAATTDQKTDRYGWFHQTRMGMFIHWGPYSVAAGEWQENVANGMHTSSRSSASLPPSMEI